jgi:hypothetical protein
MNLGRLWKEKIVDWFKAVIVFGWKIRAKDESSGLAEPVSTKRLKPRKFLIRNRELTT